jgi:hypothetical protein
MVLPLLLVIAAAYVALSWYWWRAWRLSRARRQRGEALIRLHVAGMQARQRLAMYEARAHRAIQAEVSQARRELQRRWSLYD